MGGPLTEEFTDDPLLGPAASPAPRARI